MHKKLKSAISLFLVLCLIFTFISNFSPVAQASGSSKVYNTGYNTAIIDGNGDLYMWGRNDLGQVGNNGVSNGTTKPGSTSFAVQTTPVKILSNVVSFHNDENTSAAITTNDDLYMWGASYDGSIGTGANSHQLTPVKVMSNVASVALSGSTAAAITNNGDLYTWGRNYWGQVGSNVSGTQTTPLKIMSNVASVQLSPFGAAALTNDGSLYIWGAVAFQQVGVGIPDGAETSITAQGDGNKTEVITKPVKVLDNIADFALNTYAYAALTKNGEFYVWGGQGKGNFQSKPTKMLTGVQSFATVNLDAFSSITAKGEFYYCYAGPKNEKSLAAKNVEKVISSNLYLTTSGDLYQINKQTSKKLLSKVAKANSNAALTESGDLYLLENTSKKILSNVVWLGYEKAITSTGDLYAWGDNMWGKVGNGTTEPQKEPCLILEEVALPGSTNINLTPAWYIEAMDYAFALGLPDGIPATEFSPNNNLTRAMLAQMLYNLEGKPAVSGSVFTDVPSSAWHADAINWAADTGIVNGYGNGRFGPSDNITREQMAAILYRYAQVKGYDVSARANLSNFTDQSRISSYAKDAVQWANAEGLITGVTTTSLSPTGTATCAQMATILMRFIRNNT